MSEPNFHIGQRLSYDGLLCTIRYIGPIQGTSGTWLGVEWDDPTRGKHTGSHKDVPYFTCLSKSPTAASFVRPLRPYQPSQSFISAVLDKYTSEIDRTTKTINAASQIKIGTKTAEEVGFDKIRRQLANLEYLRIIIVDSFRVDRIRDDGQKSVQEMLPRIRELDVGRNLFERVGTVVEIVRGLTEVKSLKMGGNRFREVLGDEMLSKADDVLRGISELAVNENLMNWEEITAVTGHFDSLVSLNCGGNQLSTLPGNLLLTSMQNTLTSINFELNYFTSFSDLFPLSSLTVLRNLYLKGNQISAICRPGEARPVFPKSLQYLDVSYNNVSSWSFIDELLTSFPGLLSLRIAHNPVYDAATSEGTGGSAQQGRFVAEESHMITIGRIARIKTLNFVTVTKDDRANAEIFYLSRIAKELAAVSEEEEKIVLERHPRYKELCAEYGAPDVIRQQQVNPDFLESRLITVHFTRPGTDVVMTRRLPKTLDIYAVKGVASRLLLVSPLAIRLIWETGDWDPVAALDEEAEGGHKDEEDSGELVHGHSGQRKDDEEGDSSDEEGGERRMGRWVKREVEIRDGTRQLGFCVDGMEVRVRVEMK